MGFKEKGITIGDLLILIIIVIISTFLIKKINSDSKKTAQNTLNIEILSNEYI